MTTGTPERDYITEAKEMLSKAPNEIPAEHRLPTIERAKGLLLIDIAYTLTDIRDDLKRLASRPPA